MPWRAGRVASRGARPRLLILEHLLILWGALSDVRRPETLAALGRQNAYPRPDVVQRRPGLVKIAPSDGRQECRPKHGNGRRNAPGVKERRGRSRRTIRPGGGRGVFRRGRWRRQVSSPLTPRPLAANYTQRQDRIAAYLARSTAADDQFWCSVVTTAVYCRPSCPSRHARLEHFASMAASPKRVAPASDPVGVAIQRIGPSARNGRPSWRGPGFLSGKAWNGFRAPNSRTR
jgi:hypothetical protein